MTINWQFTPLAVPLFVGAAIMLLVTIIAWQRRAARGGILLTLLGVAAIIYSLGYALELGSQTVPEVQLWLKVEYIGVTPTAGLILCLVLAFTGRQRFLTRINLGLLFAIPVITLILAWTNEQHELIWRVITLDTSGMFTRTFLTRGVWYWVQTAYFYLNLLGAAVLLMTALRQASGLYRRQLGVMLGAVLVPLSVHLVYLTGLAPAGLDLNAYGVILVAAALAWAMLDYQLFDIMPVAREAVLDSMSDAVIVSDAQDRVIELNPVALQMVDPASSKVLGYPFAEAFAAWPDVVAAFKDISQEHAEVVISVEGRERHFDLRQSALNSNRGKHQGRLTVLRDITDRVQSEMALNETNERLTTLRMIDAELSRKLDVRYVVTMALDAAMRLSLADAAFIGLAENEDIRIIQALGHYPAEVVGELLPSDRGLTARAIKARQAERVLEVSDDPDYVAAVPGMAAQITAPLLSGEKLIGVLTLQTSSPQRFSEEIFEMVKLLAARIAAAIDNAYVYEERDRLVRDLEDFAHTVAHDLKNPLAVICGFAQLLREAYGELPDDQIRDILERMEKGAEKATAIINALLLLAGVRTLETVEIDPLDMGAIVQEACTSLADVIKRCEAAISLPGAWPLAEGYRPWVEAIWVNYLSNAIKYGGSPPRIELGYDEPRGGKIRFWVRDNGRGLAEEDQDKLFRPFSRVGQHGVEGHGLGLSIVQRVVERLNGEVGVESEADQGSLFYFTLPVAREE